MNARPSRYIALGALVATIAGAPSARAQASDHPPDQRTLEQFLRTDSKSPVDYVLSRFKDHRVVLLGEAHWIRHDAQLLSALVPRLRVAGVTTFAAEWLPASAQGRIDTLVSAHEWNLATAMGVLRLAAWPYRQYLDVMRAVWEANRVPGSPLRLLALGPPANWRATLLPLGKTYETFMGERILERLEADNGRMVVALGFHHAFTRFLMPDLPEGRRARRFNDRTGNVLWRALGEDVFFIALHHPWQCRASDGKSWTRCLPLAAAIDCAASALGSAVGFDVAGSPFGALHVAATAWYGVGSPYLRFDGLVDGYIWTTDIARYEAVDLIPLSEFAPDEGSLREVLGNNPVSDDAVTSRVALDSLWGVEAHRMRNAQDTRGWKTLAAWRGACSR